MNIWFVNFRKILGEMEIYNLILGDFRKCGHPAYGLLSESENRI